MNKVEGPTRSVVPAWVAALLSVVCIISLGLAFMFWNQVSAGSSEQQSRIAELEAQLKQQTASSKLVLNKVQDYIDGLEAFIQAQEIGVDERLALAKQEAPMIQVMKEACGGTECKDLNDFAEKFYEK